MLSKSNAFTIATEYAQLHGWEVVEYAPKSQLPAQIQSVAADFYAFKMRQSDLDDVQICAPNFALVHRKTGQIVEDYTLYLLDTPNLLT
jgi:hypothetical protein